MDARRFDGFSKAWSAGTSRRRLLQALPVVALGSLIPPAARADGGVATVPTTTTTTTGTTTGAVGAGDTGTTTIPVDGATAPPAVNTEPETPATGIGAQISPTQILPARIYAGVCGQLEAEPAFQLIDIGAAGAEGTATPASTTPVGAASAIPVRSSTTIVDALLDDLTASEYAIDIRIEADDPATSVVCGDIGGILGGQEGSELAIGLAERNGSGYTGIASLQEDGEQTVVDLFIAAGLANGGVGAATAPVVATTTEPAATDEAATPADAEADADSAFTAGGMVVTTADVNLRAAPSLDAAIIAILGAGVELEVTGPATDGWVPVLEVATGRRGFITDAFLTSV